MARKGTFGSKLTPFGGGGSLSDLSVYQLKPTYTAADPPPVPTVAPEAGVLPQPVLPRPTLPGIYLNPDTSAAREENAALGGAWRKGVLLAENPTTAQINATYAWRKGVLLAELFAAGG